MQTDYKNHMEKKLYEVEMSFMPATQIDIEKDNKIDEIQKSIWEKNEKIQLLKSEIIEDQLKIVNLRNTRDSRDGERRQFIRNCPSETCKGFLSSQWKCGLCNIHACKDCHEIKTAGEEHVCDPKVVETVLMLAKDSKNCPKCSASIYKIDGCDQMFCTQCHTSFSWTSLKIVTSGIHNPHYYEWLRNNSPDGEIERTAEEGEGYCPQVLRNPWVLRDKLRGIQIEKSTIDTFWEVFRIIQHITDVELRRFPTLQQTDLTLNMDIRKKYMKGEMDKEAFQSQVQQRDKKRRKCNDFCQIWTMFVNICTEHINEMYATVGLSPKHIVDLLQTIKSLTEYSNAASEGIGRRYSSVFPMINLEWQFVSMRRSK
jgi:hypothetical protein